MLGGGGVGVGSATLPSDRQEVDRALLGPFVSLTYKERDNDNNTITNGNGRSFDDENEELTKTSFSLGQFFLRQVLLTRLLKCTSLLSQ